MLTPENASSDDNCHVRTREIKPNLPNMYKPDAAFVVVTTTASVKRVEKLDPISTGVQRGLAGSRKGKLLSRGYVPET